MLVNTPLVVACQDKQFIAWKHTIQQSQDAFLFFLVIDLFKLIKQHNTWLFNCLHKLIETVTMPWSIDHDGRNILFSTLDAQCLCKQCLTRTFFAIQHNTSAIGAIKECVDNTVSILSGITIQLAWIIETINLFQKQVTLLILLNNVITSRKMLMNIKRHFIADTVGISVTKIVSHGFLSMLELI